MNLAPGVRVGPYEILAPLGAGGMGEVYRARDQRLGRDVALKILSTELSSSSEHLRRFEQEARAASALNHPNIITIYDIGTFDSMAYIAMELIEGRDVRSMLSGEPLAMKQALRIVVKVADGLAAAHERGIVHRDLKPENLMVSRDGFVKILDFGLAKLVLPFTDRDMTLPHTTPGAVFGTVGYMSPEQAAAREIDFHSDQFALGVILYEMLTGRMPFSERTAAETLAAIIRNDPPPLTAYNDRVPPELVRIVTRLLAKEPQDRYASTLDLARDLREVRDKVGSSSGARHDSGAGIAPIRRPALMVAAGVLVVLLGAAAAIMFRQRQPIPPAPAAAEAGSIAVLPFVSRSPLPEGQVFADGVAEIISTRLEQSGVKVIRMFDASNAGSAPEMLRRALGRGAAKAIRGEVVRNGADLSVKYSVLEASSGREVSGKTIAGSSDLSALEREVVDGIRASLNLEATGPRTGAESVGFTTSADHHAYVDALGLLQRARDEQSIDRAIETLQKLLLNARDSAMVNAQLARAYLYKSQLSRRPELIEQATVYAERAVEIDGQEPEIRMRLGQLRLEAGRYGEAEEEFRRALSMRSNDPDATLGLAVANEKLGRAGDAERMYQQAIALRPDHGHTYNRYAVFLFNGGRYETAAANFRRFTELMPTARGFSNLGEAYRALGRYEDADRTFRESIGLEQTTDGYAGLGDVHYYMGRYTDARQAYLTAVTLSPTNHPAWLGLGHALRRSGAPQKTWAEAYEKAVAAARAAIAVNPRDATAHAIAAIAMASLGQANEAAAASNTALKIDPTEKTALYAAAVVAHNRSATNTAVTWLDGAIRAGYPVSDLQRDPEFLSIRDDPGFRRVLQQQH